MHTENTASTTSLVFGDAPIYRYSMCDGTEYNFNRCQLPRPDSNSACPSLGTVNCTEGIIRIYELYAKNPLTFCVCNFSRCYSDGSFRLVNVTTSTSADDSITVSGRIEVCSNSSYKSLCSQHWDPVDAQIFCRDYMRIYHNRYSPETISKKLT